MSENWFFFWGGVHTLEFVSQSYFQRSPGCVPARRTHVLPCSYYTSEFQSRLPPKAVVLALGSLWRTFISSFRSQSQFLPRVFMVIYAETNETTPSQKDRPLPAETTRQRRRSAFEKNAELSQTTGNLGLKPHQQRAQHSTVILIT